MAVNSSMEHGNFALQCVPVSGGCEVVWFRDKVPAAPGFYAGQLSDSGNITLLDVLYRESAKKKTVHQSVLFHTSFSVVWNSVHCVGFIGEKH